MLNHLLMEQMLSRELYKKMYQKNETDQGTKIIDVKAEGSCKSATTFDEKKSC
jgi:hypothetical protein